MRNAPPPNVVAAANTAGPACGALPPRRFEIRVQPSREAVGVAPVGELDLAGSRRLSAAMDELVENGFDDIVIDLRGLEFIECAGVRVLLAQHAAAVRDGRRLSLIPGRAAIRRVFALTHTLDMLPFDRHPGMTGACDRAAWRAPEHD